MAKAQTTAAIRSPLLSALALSGLVGAFTFVVLVVLGGATTGGYSHVDQMISELGARGADYAWLQTSNFVLVGICILGFAAALHLIARPPLPATLLVVLFGVLSGLAQASLPCDEGCEPETATGTAHIVTGATGFIAVLAAMFLLSRHWRGDEGWQHEARFTRALAYAGLVGLVAFNITRATGAEAVDGLAQRAFALSVLIWLAGMSLALYRRTLIAPASHRLSAPTQPGVRTLSR